MRPDDTGIDATLSSHAVLTEHQSTASIHRISPPPPAAEIHTWKYHTYYIYPFPGAAAAALFAAAIAAK